MSYTYIPQKMDIRSDYYKYLSYYVQLKGIDVEAVIETIWQGAAVSNASINRIAGAMVEVIEEYEEGIISFHEFTLQDIENWG